MNVGAVILAGGASRRFGSPKPLARVGDQTLIRRAVGLAREAGCAPCVAVVGAFAAPLERELDGSGAEVVVNPLWEEGIASSIRAAVAHLRHRAEPPAGALFLLADQVRLTSGGLKRLVDRFRADPGSAVASRYAGVLGVPAVFPVSEFPRLELLRGDAGARVLLRSGAVETVAVDFPEAAFDVDAPGDL